MAGYSNVLLALDFHSDNEALIEKGKAVAEQYGAKLFVIHVQEPIAAAYTADGFAFNEQLASLHGAIRQEARTRLDKMAERFGLEEDQVILAEGNPSDEIHEAQESHNIDLIVLGTHGQKGIQLLLGSTANSVLHGVKCDVLTIRL